MSNFGDYFLNELLALELPKREWLVENLIREGDSVILVGDEKSGKSLLIFQLISSLTSGQPFLDTYNTHKERKVVYVQLEGELSDSQDRFRRLQKSLEYKPDNCLLMYRAPLEMQSREFSQNLTRAIYEKLGKQKPDIVILDPVYFCFSGSLNDNEVVRQFIGNVRIMKEVLGCAIILVHHTHKTRWSSDGFLLNEGDDAIFGSKFFKAWADHTLLFTYDKKQQMRVLSCDTQRSGAIIKKSNLKLIEPDPLYFEINNEHTVPLKDLMIVELLKANLDGLTRIEIMEQLGINNQTFYRSIKPALNQGLIVKSENQRPVIFKYNENGKESIVEDKTITQQYICPTGQGSGQD